MKIVGVAFWNFQPHVIKVLTKIRTANVIGYNYCSSGSIPKRLKIGPVCSFQFDLDTILIALFCDTNETIE